MGRCFLNSSRTKKQWSSTSARPTKKSSPSDSHVPSRPTSCYRACRSESKFSRLQKTRATNGVLRLCGGTHASLCTGLVEYTSSSRPTSCCRACRSESKFSRLQKTRETNSDTSLRPCGGTHASLCTGLVESQVRLHDSY